MRRAAIAVTLLATFAVTSAVAYRYWGDRAAKWYRRLTIAQRLMFEVAGAHSALRLPPSCEAAAYELPELDFQPGRVTISSDGPSAGLALTTCIDPERTHRLRLDGDPLLGEVTVRLQVGDGPKSYLSAPRGALEIPITGGDKVEALIYGDLPFVYEFRSLQIEPCDDCWDDGDLRDQILAELPELHSLLVQDRLSAAHVLLDWAANAIDFAPGPLYFELDASLKSLSAAQFYYDIFRKDHGAVYCAGAAVFFSKVLQLFDYTSFTVDFGEADTQFTHVTTVLAFPCAAGWSFFILDPTFNVVLCRAGSVQMLPVDELLEEVDDARPFAVEARAGSLSERDFVLPMNYELPPGARRARCLGSGSQSPRSSNAWHAFACDTLTLEAWLDRSRAQFRRLGFSEGLRGLLQLLHRRVYSVGACSPPGARQAFLALLAEKNIPQRAEAP